MHPLPQVLLAAWFAYRHWQLRQSGRWLEELEAEEAEGLGAGEEEAWEACCRDALGPALTRKVRPAPRPLCPAPKRGQCWPRASR